MFLAVRPARARKYPGPASKQVLLDVYELLHYVDEARLVGGQVEALGHRREHVRRILGATRRADRAAAGVGVIPDGLLDGRVDGFESFGAQAGEALLTQRLDTRRERAGAAAEAACRRRTTCTTRRACGVSVVRQAREPRLELARRAERALVVLVVAGRAAGAGAAAAAAACGEAAESGPAGE